MKHHQKETIKYCEDYLNEKYATNEKPIKKVFYRHYEWSGWRFYLKALVNLDFGSLIGHIKKNKK